MADGVLYLCGPESAASASSTNSCTDLTQYRLPLLEIVGVKSTKLTFSVAFAYLEHEREESFTWALQKLKELLYHEKLLPNVMVMDRELTLMNAIDYVYPNASHLLCTFHILKNVSMKCKEYVKSERQEHVMDQWNNMMYSNTEDEFDVHLNHFESVCGDIPSFFKQCIQLIGKELEKVKFVGASKERCGCYIRTPHGLSFACQLAGYQILGIPIPLETIHVFWTKLQISKHDVSPDESKWDLDEECKELKRQFSTLDIVGQRALNKKVRDLAYPSTTLMCPVKYKPKRGVKKSRKGEESDVHRDPSQWEYADASQEIQTTKRSCTQPSGSQSSTMPIVKQPSINSAKGEYLSQFPAFFYPYINDIIDVEPDGNCGFFCISSALGWESYDVWMHLDTQIHQYEELFSKLFYDTVSYVRNSLLVKHLGVQSKDKWMSISDMSYPIASRYNVVYVSLSMRINITFFPLLIAPPPYTSRHTIIAVGFVNNNHWDQDNGDPPRPVYQEILEEEHAKAYLAVDVLPICPSIMGIEHTCIDKRLFSDRSEVKDVVDDMMT
ncbi:uncharacterized protein LOC131605735 [Vicia villosa]|uniref:uncharacterized protein LOC131605735 n=1 Tax=Vicia villosa TaxID=3911 RepID=UPI00273C493D|nr:uncharacterized protein LOC131605735 [Vicia villosa]